MHQPSLISRSLIFPLWAGLGGSRQCNSGRLFLGNPACRGRRHYRRSWPNSDT